MTGWEGEWGGGPRDHYLPFEQRADIAAFLQAAGVRLKASTFIDDVTITRGFGRLDDYGEWEYPLL